jgi:hypothetical protein
VLSLVAASPTPIASVIAIAATFIATIAIAAFTTTAVAALLHGLGNLDNYSFAA